MIMSILSSVLVIPFSEVSTLFLDVSNLLIDSKMMLFGP